MSQVRLPPTARGMDFVRLAIVTAIHDKNAEGAAATAARLWGPDSPAARIMNAGGLEMVEYEKANIVAGGTISGNWAEPLAMFDDAAAEFFALVRETSLIGRIPGLRKLPMQTRVVSALTGTSAAWVGEGQAVPLSNATFAEDTLAPRKVSALAVITDELAKSSDPRAEFVIRNDMVRAIADAIDATFIDAANSGTAGIKPASVTNGADSIASTGDGVQDIRNLIAGFPGDLQSAVLVGSGDSFAAMHDPIFMPGLGVRGGEALGIPAIPSEAAGTTLALIDPSGVAVAEWDMELRTSRQGTVEMKSDPSQSSVAPTAVNQVSLWQTNSVGIMTNQAINWEVTRPSVRVVTGVAPGAIS